ncbi:HAMP domain-containing histidine kinase [Microbacterium sp. KUDC0406]|uniref:sensor histidine kinase n=1 Tax=Microbacterium sp. KUDC0406 TaxID=2909588 RepID=UPI001F3285E5|nr:HAMP domain-containing sensor histidine kinase [Microbacterium sp. KUDC0406]UJP10282.1 HAMP domain-containing histidine kinase [Microbacterium sp. KUDC0406]
MTFLAADPASALQRVRDRAVLLNQVMVGGVVVLATFLALGIGTVLHVMPLMMGLLLIFLATGTAFVVPWERGPVGLMLLLPLVDIFAIMLLCAAAPASGFPLLWTFPAMWVGSSLGALGVVAGTTVITAAYWGAVVLNYEQPVTPTLAVLPVVIAGLATIASVASWRSGAQRVVLEKQSRELRRAVERARRQEDLVTEVLDAVDFGVVRLTSDGEQVVTNDAIGRLRLTPGAGDPTTAYAEDGITVLDPDELPLARARRGEEADSTLVWFGEPGDPARRALRFTCRRVTEADLAHGGMIVVAQDITAEELALRAREDLIASVSHELRTPLTSITGYVDLVLEDDRLPSPVRRSLEVVERNAARLLTIVSDLLAASSMSHMGVAFSLEPEDTDLIALVEASVEAFQLPAAERGMMIETAAPHPVRAYVDPHRIRQVVDNLVSNAVKYGDIGGHVRIDVLREEDRVAVVVGDDGPGVPEAEVPRLFDRFFRSALVRQSVTHGSGLGLAISRDIVRAHGGELTVRTRPGEGAEFTVQLPFLQIREEA